jgi:hypothetical protein
LLVHHIGCLLHLCVLVLNVATLQYQQDIQTKLRPGEFADRMDDKPARLAAATDWQTVLRLFVELGDNTDR